MGEWNPPRPLASERVEGSTDQPIPNPGEGLTLPLPLPVARGRGAVGGSIGVIFASDLSKRPIIIWT